MKRHVVGCALVHPPIKQVNTAQHYHHPEHKHLSHMFYSALPTYTTKDDAQKFTSSLTSEQLLTQLNISLLKLFSTLSSFLQHHQNAKLPYDDPFPDVRALRHPLSILFSKSSCSLLLGELEFTISTLHFSRRLRYEHS